MSETIFTRDGGISAFDSASGVVSTDDDGVDFSWDEEHVVRLDAPADLEGAFDTDRFYKIEDATIARPIKQPYLVGDDIEWYKKPAEELRKAAWTFDNNPFVFPHPDTGMVKDVNDVHGFWRNVHYQDDSDRLRGDLYIPTSDQDALDWIEKHQDVSPGFYNRVTAEYDGDTGDLTDDDVDGFQTDLYGDHIAGVEQGRCTGSDGCGLEHDGSAHGDIVTIDETTSFLSQNGMEESEKMFTEGDEVVWRADAVVAHNPEDEDGVMVEILDKDGESTEMVTTVDTDSILHKPMTRDHNRDYVIAPPTNDYTDDNTYYAIAPDETDGDEPKYPINSCSDVDDAWHLRGHGDYAIEQSTLENRIQERARELDCSVPDTDETNDDSPESTEDCGCSNMTDDDNDFELPDLSVDALAEKNDAVSDLKAERDSLEEAVDEMEQTITEAFDEAEHFSVELDEDECPCEAVDDLVSDLDEKVAKIEDFRDELDKYREVEIEERLDTLEDLGADRDEWGDENLDALDEEIERREEVLEAADADMSVKDIDESVDSNGDTNSKTMSGTRSFGRGHGA